MAGRYANSPGPKYGAMTTTGYEGHDPTLPRAPAHSIGSGRKQGGRTGTPGAKYNTAGVAARGGRLRTREAYLEGKPKFSLGPACPAATSLSGTLCADQRGPSAQAYGAHLCPDTTHARPPAWWILGRSVPAPRRVGPAPKYRLHDLIGTQAPGFSAAPHYSLLGLSGSCLGKSSSPGPGRYGSVANELIFGRAPTPLVLSNHPPSTKRSQTIPAPKYRYTFNEKLEPPSYSFGVRHSPQTSIVYTHQDRQPFYGF